MNEYLEDLLCREVLSENEQIKKYLEEILSTDLRLGLAVFKRIQGSKKDEI